MNVDRALVFKSIDAKKPFPEKNQMFFTLFQPQQRQDLCPLKFNPIIICGVKLTQKQSRKSLFGLLMTKIAK